MGGVVRDAILGKTNFDLDIVVEKDAIKFASLLAKNIGAGYKKHHAFGTATVYAKNHKIDFATARREYYPFWGSLPKVKPSSIREDLARRDFTINAMAMSLNADNYGELIDAYGGFQDLKRGLIRILYKESFLDDPTRILRAVRFKIRFSFKLEHKTARLLKEANSLKALKFVDEQRIRNELILILKEDNPPRYLKELWRITNFYFLNGKKIRKDELVIFNKIKNSISFYKRNFPRHRKIDEWLIYIMGCIFRMNSKEAENFCRTFAFRRGERIRLVSSVLLRNKILKKLAKKTITKSEIYTLLEPLSFETLIFFHAFSKDKKVKGNIAYFISELSQLRLKIKGKDLKEKGLKPHSLYGKVLKKTLHQKINKGLSSHQEELDYAQKIFKKIRRSGARSKTADRLRSKNIKEKLKR